MRHRLTATIIVLIVVAIGLAAHLTFKRTGNEVALWLAAFLLWPAYLIRTAIGASKRWTLLLLAIAATLYYGAIAVSLIFGKRPLAIAILTAHAAGTALIGWMMAQILDVARGMEALQD